MLAVILVSDFCCCCCCYREHSNPAVKTLRWFTEYSSPAVKTLLRLQSIPALQSRQWLGHREYSSPAVSTLGLQWVFQPCSQDTVLGYRVFKPCSQDTVLGYSEYSNPAVKTLFWATVSIPTLQSRHCFGLQWVFKPCSQDTVLGYSEYSNPAVKTLFWLQSIPVPLSRHCLGYREYSSPAVKTLFWLQRVFHAQARVSLLTQNWPRRILLGISFTYTDLHPHPPLPDQNDVLSENNLCEVVSFGNNSSEALQPAKTNESVSNHQNNICLGGWDLASAKQLVYSATSSFNSCGEQSHKDRVQRSNCWDNSATKTIRPAMRARSSAFLFWPLLGSDSLASSSLLLLYVHRNCTDFGTSPRRPSRLSHSSWALIHWHIGFGYIYMYTSYQGVGRCA